MASPKYNQSALFRYATLQYERIPTMQTIGYASLCVW
jgi:hypothetical protein